MATRRLSGFAQFPDNDSRDQFVRTVTASGRILSERGHLSTCQPTIVFENLTAAEHQKVLKSLQGLGRWVEDVQFDPMQSLHV
jgi:hypothetical protein